MSQKINELRHKVAQPYEPRHYDDTSELATEMCDVISQHQHGEDNSEYTSCIYNLAEFHYETNISLI